VFQDVRHKILPLQKLEDLSAKISFLSLSLMLGKNKVVCLLSILAHLHAYQHLLRQDIGIFTSTTKNITIATATAVAVTVKLTVTIAIAIQVTTTIAITVTITITFTVTIAISIGICSGISISITIVFN
jgi:hypothetical protein